MDHDAPSAATLAATVNNGALSAEEVARDTLERAARLDPVLHAFAALDPAQVLAEARAVDARLRRGGALALAGVPVPLKATQSPDGPLAARLRAAGAVPFGATAVPPRGYHQTWGLTPAGRTRNPWDLDRSPGGSSAGAAAVVAAGIVPLAAGGDSAGSLRIPAAFCGVVGHKPTAGLLPRRRPGTYRLTTSGAVSRSVEDQARFLDAVADGPAGVHLAALEADLPRPLRAAWSDDLGHVEVDPELAELAQVRAEELVAAGAVTLADVAVDLPSLRDVWGRLRRAERLALTGQAVPGDLVTAEVLAVRAESLCRLGRLFEEVDVLLLPTTPVGAHLVEDDPPGYECELTWTFNVAGLPATSVPAGRTAAGLPVGLQIVGRPGADTTCLRLAAELERRHGPAPVARVPLGRAGSRDADTPEPAGNALGRGRRSGEGVRSFPMRP